MVNLVLHCHFELETQQLRSVVLAICEPSSPHMWAALKKFIKEIVMRFNKSCLYSFTLKPPRIIPKKYGSVYWITEIYYVLKLCFHSKHFCSILVPLPSSVFLLLLGKAGIIPLSKGKFFTFHFVLHGLIGSIFEYSTAYSHMEK